VNVYCLEVPSEYQVPPSVKAFAAIVAVADAGSVGVEPV
jgi:hypothetical protein